MKLSSKHEVNQINKTCEKFVVTSNKKREEKANRKNAARNNMECGEFSSSRKSCFSFDESLG